MTIIYRQPEYSYANNIKETEEKRNAGVPPGVLLNRCTDKKPGMVVATALGYNSSGDVGSRSIWFPQRVDIDAVPALFILVSVRTLGVTDPRATIEPGGNPSRWHLVSNAVTLMLSLPSEPCGQTSYRNIDSEHGGQEEKSFDCLFFVFLSRSRIARATL